MLRQRRKKIGEEKGERERERKEEMRLKKIKNKKNTHEISRDCT